MRLSEVQGQSQVLSYLENVLRNERLHHGLLFAGQDGVGKRTTAQRLANRLLCSQPNGLDACGTCGHCIRFHEGTHADYLVVQRAQKSDGSLEKVIKVDQVRNMQRMLSLKSFEGGVRVILILDADSMNSSTANALLKTLEEPPQGAFFILTSNATSALLPTVVSRCQLVRFAPLSTEALSHIASGFSVDNAGDLSSAIKRSNGSASRLVTMLDPDVLSLYEECARRIERLGKDGTAIDALEFAEKDAGDKQKRAPYLVIDILQNRYRDVLVQQHADVGESMTPVAILKIHQELVEFLSRLDRIRSELNSNQRNMRIAMEEIWFGVAQLEKSL